MKNKADIEKQGFFDNDSPDLRQISFRSLAIYVFAFVLSNHLVLFHATITVTFYVLVLKYKCGNSSSILTTGSTE